MTWFTARELEACLHGNSKSLTLLADVEAYRRLSPMRLMTFKCNATGRVYPALYTVVTDGRGVWRPFGQLAKQHELKEIANERRADG